MTAFGTLVSESTSLSVNDLRLNFAPGQSEIRSWEGKSAPEALTAAVAGLFSRQPLESDAPHE
jgi:hypothetical protein